MASLLYGCLHPCPKTKEYPVAASQYFYHEGFNACYLDGSGHVTGALTATATLLGYAIIPVGSGAGTSADYWLSSATAGADKVQVIDALDNYEFLAPGIITVTAAMIGDKWDLVAVNDGTATYVDFDTDSTAVVICTDLGVNVKAGAPITSGVVKFNPSKRQAD